MLCEKCKKNEATFYYHENVNGNQKNYRLCADCANRVGWFAANLDKAAGDRKGSHQATAKARFFAEMDMPFRRWLTELDAESNSEAMKAASQNWRNQARTIALRVGETMITEMDNTAFIGRIVKERQGGKDVVENHYSAPEAWIAFRRSIYKLYPIDNEVR